MMVKPEGDAGRYHTRSRTSGTWARRAAFAASLACLVLFPFAAVAAAQPATGVVLGAGAGGTYYCIVSRCNTGFVLGGLAALDVAPFVQVEANVRRHFCFDCDRFWMADGSVLLRVPGGAVTPFAGGGVGLSSDPAFMGTRWGPQVSAGVWVDVGAGWAVQLGLRGRQVDRGDRLGEVGVVVGRRLLTRR